MVGFDLYIYVVVSVFSLSVVFNYFLILFYKRNNILDIPNERSAHLLPTPRGGGVSILLFIVIYAAWIEFWVSGPGFLVWLGGMTFLVGLVAAIDDMCGLKAIVRLVFYAVFSFLFVVGVSSLSFSHIIDIILILFFLIFMLWMTNLYNFMDGADGFAGIQALILALPMGFIFGVSEREYEALLSFIIASAATGFLVWNWSPAKIFMGDVGSCSLGFVFAGLMLICYQLELLSVYLWLILLSVFVVDSTLTLIMRIFTGKKWYEAHSDHAYQCYLKMGHSHKSLAAMFLLFGVFFLWPFVYLAYSYSYAQFYMTIFIYVSLSGVWWVVQKKYNQQTCL